MTPVKKDLSDLPAAAKDEGFPPVANPIYAPMLAQAWAATVDRSPRPHAIEGTRFRHSDAGKCARAISYITNGTEESNPADVASIWAMELGTKVHELIQAVYQDAFGENAQVEVKVDLRPFGLDSSGHIDVVITIIQDGKPWVIAIEIKTINGFGYKMAMGDRGAAQGPRSSAILQAALNGRAVNADEVIVIYLAMESISKSAADKKKLSETNRFCAEWHYSREQFEPLADAEIKRINRIFEFVDEGKLAPRSIADPAIPPKARITDPSKGTWQLIQDGQILEAGTTWMCDYCPFKDTCIKDGATDE